MKRLISILMLLCLLLQGAALAESPADRAAWLEPLQSRVEDEGRSASPALRGI